MEPLAATKDAMFTVNYARLVEVVERHEVELQKLADVVDSMAATMLARHVNFGHIRIGD